VETSWADITWIIKPVLSADEMSCHYLNNQTSVKWRWVEPTWLKQYKKYWVEILPTNEVKYYKSHHMVCPCQSICYPLFLIVVAHNFTNGQNNNTISLFYLNWKNDIFFLWISKMTYARIIWFFFWEKDHMIIFSLMLPIFNGLRMWLHTYRYLKKFMMIIWLFFK